VFRGGRAVTTDEKKAQAIIKADPDALER